MYNNNSRRKPEVIVFKRFGRKGYSLFSCLGREVIISTLSVATLTHARDRKSTRLNSSHVRTSRMPSSA